jgi:hypothetical protein
MDRIAFSGWNLIATTPTSNPLLGDHPSDILNMSAAARTNLPVMVYGRATFYTKCRPSLYDDARWRGRFCA